MALIQKSNSLPDNVSVNGPDIVLFPNPDDNNRLWYKTVTEVGPVRQQAQSIQGTPFPNPDFLDATAIGKFAMLHPTSPGATVYQWTSLPAQRAFVEYDLIKWTNFTNASGTMIGNIGGNFTNGQTIRLLIGLTLSSTNTITFVNTVTNPNTQVLIGPDLLATLNNLQAQLNNASSFLHELEITSILVSGSDFEIDFQARQAGINGNQYELQIRSGSTILATQTLSGGEDRSAIRLVDPTGNEDLLVDATIDVPANSNLTIAAQDIASFINLNSTWQATSTQSVLIIQYKLVGDIGNLATLEIASLRNGSTILTWNQRFLKFGISALSGPTEFTLGKIVDVDITTVYVDTQSAIYQAPVEANVNKGDILIVNNDSETLIKTSDVQNTLLIGDITYDFYFTSVAKAMLDAQSLTYGGPTESWVLRFQPDAIEP